MTGCTRLSSWIVIAAFAAGASAAGPARSGQEFPGYFEFEGRFLLVASDADMVASAYIDDDLGSRTPEMGDRLTVIPLGHGPNGLKPVAIPVSNSVTGWPSNVAVSGDGKHAYVTEVAGPAGEGLAKRSELPPGTQVTVVDLSKPAAPKVVQTVTTNGVSFAAALRPDGKVLAVNVGEREGQSIYLYPVKPNGQLGDPAVIGFPGVEGPCLHIEWRPSGRFLAATFPVSHELRFYRIGEGKAGSAEIEPWGKPITTGKFPGVGHWTPDGRHVVVTNLHWLGGTDGLYLGAHAGMLSVVAFDEDEAGGVHHAQMSNAAVGGGPEEFAISPDGRRVVSLNMHNSFAPPGDKRLTFYSSLTLLDLDPETGRLVARGTFPFEAILPEGITFDVSGRYLAVANFAHFNPQRDISQTTVDFWRVIDGPDPLLVQMDVQVPIMRGAHIIKVVP
jgi:DNA-binding beta-propeller fold protein YncE